MTDEEIDAIEAGREMDALIHQRVFGFKASPHTAWRYSTDIAAAWQVVEKLRELNLIGHFREALDFAPIWGWLDFSASDLSFLICRAALKCCKAVADKKVLGGAEDLLSKIIAKRN